MARILITDDDPDIRKLIIFALSDEGHELQEAGDGQAALDAIEKDAPDLVVLDVMMPRKDGYEVLEEMSASALRTSVKVLILTARASEHDWERGFEVGADHYMTKPFDPDELVDTVRQMLEASNEELAERREREHDKAHLLSQIESLFGTNEMST